MQSQVNKFLAQEICIINTVFQPWQKCLPKLNENVAQQDRLLFTMLQLGVSKGSLPDTRRQV